MPVRIRAVVPKRCRKNSLPAGAGNAFCSRRDSCICEQVIKSRRAVVSLIPQYLSARKKLATYSLKFCLAGQHDCGCVKRSFVPDQNQDLMFRVECFPDALPAITVTIDESNSSRIDHPLIFAARDQSAQRMPARHGVA